MINQQKAGMPVEEDRISRMLLRLPVVYDWYNYKGETKFVSVNYEATVKAGRPMMDICYCATKCMNGLVEKTVQFDKNKFTPICHNIKM